MRQGWVGPGPPPLTAFLTFISRKDNSHSYTQLILALGIVREPTVLGFITSNIYLTRNESQKGREWRGSCLDGRIEEIDVNLCRSRFLDCDRALKDVCSLSHPAFRAFQTRLCSGPAFRGGTSENEEGVIHVRSSV